MKILITLSRFPYPLEKGDKLRAFHQIKHLSEQHDIALFCISETLPDAKAMAALKPYCKNIKVVQLSKFQIIFNIFRSVFQKLPFQVGYFYFSKAQKAYHDFIALTQPDHIYCQLIRTAEYAKDIALPKTLDYMDIFSKGIDRRKANAPFYFKPILHIEYLRLLKYEANIFDYFKHKTIISEQDKNLIPHPRREEVVVIPNGVDSDYFKPITMEKKYDLLFNGNMSYPPNVESVEFFVKEVMPSLLKEFPKLRLLISGASPSMKVKALKSDAVIISGWVDDIRENFAQSKILVAPMQISIGLQNKLLEAMAMRMPCVCSKLANNALKAKPGEEIMLAETAEEYVACIRQLLQDAAFKDKIAEKGHQYVLDHFNWKSNTAILAKLFEQN